MVKPNEARNLGVAATASELVVIADNDIEYEPGWLDALESHAEENGSDAVAPLICIGPPAATTIHHAGGILKATRAAGGTQLSEAHRLMDVPLADGRDRLPEVHLLRWRRERSVPLVAVPREKGWINPLAERQHDSIWLGVKRDDSAQTALAQALLAMPRPSL
jgi:hypothetical protein